jgi:hypothetical protein
MDLPAASSDSRSMKRRKRSGRGYKGIFMSLLPALGGAAKA